MDFYEITRFYTYNIQYNMYLNIKISFAVHLKLKQIGQQKIICIEKLKTRDRNIYDVEVSTRFSRKLNIKYMIYCKILINNLNSNAFRINLNILHPIIIDFFKFKKKNVLVTQTLKRIFLFSLIIKKLISNFRIESIIKILF